MTDVILSDGEPCTVKQLGIYELDPLTPKPIGPYIYKMEVLGGVEEEVIFPLDRFIEKPPEKPSIPESDIEEGSAAWFELRTWQLYQAALTHEERRNQAAQNLGEDVVAHILTRSIDPADIPRIVTFSDWQLVYTAAMVPQVTYELLRDTLNQFNAAFDGQEVLEAIQKIEGGKGTYNPIRVWENKIMVVMGRTELEWALIDVEERARKIVSYYLDDWIGALEMDRIKIKDPKLN